jgi:hypothetical protein
MDGQKALDVDLETAPVVPTSRPVVGGLPVWVAVVAGLLGPALAVVRSGLEPVPADPDAALPLIAVVVGVAELATWVGAAWAALFQRRAAVAWATGAAALAVVGAIACPTTGHHVGVGVWWYAELAVCLGALVGSVALLRRFSRAS